MSDDPAGNGVRGVSAAAVAAAASAVAELRAPADQVELFAVPEVRALPLSTAEAAAEAARRGRGRPIGSVNRSTRELREFLASKGYDPVLSMARWGQMEPEELAQRLGISRAEAFDKLMRTHEALAPFIHAKLAPTDGQGNAVPMLHFSLGEAAEAVERAPWERRYGSLADQGVTVDGTAPAEPVAKEADCETGEKP